MTGARDADLVVVGGGPVGLVAALHAARAGLDVVVVEPRQTPVDKACGEGILPAGLAHLAELGIDPSGHPLRAISYHDGDGRSVRAQFRHGPGRGVRRTVLHGAISEAALAAGVVLVRGRVVGLEQADVVSVRLQGGSPLRAAHVIAADGLHSPTRRLLGLDRPARGQRRHGLRRHLLVQPWSDDVEVYWDPLGEAYVTPVGPGLVGVALLTGEVAPYDTLLEGFPSLLARLDGARPANAVRGAGPLRQRALRPVDGRVLLVGDAAGYVDALTGEGLSIGWAQTRAAVAAVAADAPGRYARAFPIIGAGGRLLTHGLVTATRAPVIRRRLVGTAASAPVLFRSAVTIAASGR